jgi:hypothetical protein
VRDHGDMLDALHLIIMLIGRLILLWVSILAELQGKNKHIY